MREGARRSRTDVSSTSQSGIEVMKSAAWPDETRCSAHASTPWQPTNRNAPAAAEVSHCCPGWTLQPAAPEQPEVEQGRSTAAANRYGQQRWHLGHGIPDGEEGPTPEQVDRGERRGDCQPGAGGLSPD